MLFNNVCENRKQKKNQVNEISHTERIKCKENEERENVDIAESMVANLLPKVIFLPSLHLYVT